ncbi:hypothetical protein MATR_02280 [Marivirga tractuosa]|uniref:Uncharacterized protein n=1 Tax=Marivirga tractuosa (strain ATCC 23168 / DSM 4126 / NBRC 15989 / NCIMB 1408 / VKM B-1430 / H-43) TaxID=643867 RepID=E4TV42_MARTH|nr:hypothetical protein Ftrac_2153 [Marivirga tractuosa DSM 4126]BDD13403.1 hypothetical protein MATR_02280 [Marivirga tractuosa]
MKNRKFEKEKAPFRKGFVAILVLAIAIFGLYNIVLEFLKYMGIL